MINSSGCILSILYFKIPVFQKQNLEKMSGMESSSFKVILKNVFQNPPKERLSIFAVKPIIFSLKQEAELWQMQSSTRHVSLHVEGYLYNPFPTAAIV